VLLDPSISAPQAQDFPLTTALLVYGQGDAAFAMRHPVTLTEGVPELAPGRPVSAAFISALAKRVRGSVPTGEYLPAYVLYREPGTIVWWTPRRRTHLFFGDRDGAFAQLNGFEVGVPALVWRLKNGTALSVRAITGDTRPEPSTPLMVAPFWNLYDGGKLCIGSMTHPVADSVSVIDGWVAGFFGSQFTHPNVNRERLTTHPDGFFPAWISARAQAGFVDAWLAPAKETLAQFMGQLTND
jgi:PRTRC genetic system protein B